MSKIILTTDKDQIVDTNDPIQPTTLNIFLAVSYNNINRLLVTVYSLLKYSQSNFNIYIMTDVNEEDKIGIQEKFNRFSCDRLNLQILTTTLLNEYVSRNRLPFNLTALAYGKMFIPTILSNLDRVLYLDYDAIPIKEGIEWLYNIDFKDKYIVANNETITCNKAEAWNGLDIEHKIFETFGDFYFNNGVILFNIPKIIASGKDKEMIEILKTPPTSQNNEELAEIKNNINYSGQKLSFHLEHVSFLNWIFRENDVLNCNKIFNSAEDNLYSINENRIRNLKNQWGFEDYQDYFNNIVIAHYGGPAKPWYNRLGNISAYQNFLFGKYVELQREMKHSI